MKLNIQFANGDERIYDAVNETDFKMAVQKLLLRNIVIINNKEVYTTNMIVKIEETNAN